MPPTIQQILTNAFGRFFECPPMPPGALPPGALAHTPSGRAVMELLWWSMFTQTLVQGIVIGIVLVIAVQVASLLRSHFTGFIQGAIVNATRNPPQ